VILDVVSLKGFPETARTADNRLLLRKGIAEAVLVIDRIAFERRLIQQFILRIWSGE